RVVIEVRRGENTDVLLNNLFAQTQMKTVFGINMVALVDNQPRTLNLKEVLETFIRHRQEVVTRRTIFELKKARERAHLLEGLTVALANIDEMIAIIKASKTSADAKSALLEKTWTAGQVQELLARSGSDLCRPEGLSSEYGLKGAAYQLSPAQVDAILEMKLQRLTGLEQDKISQEYRDILGIIANLIDILSDHQRLMKVISDELIEIKTEFGDARRTEITNNDYDLSIEDLIAEEDMVVTLSDSGYVKAQPVSEYQSQHRGGRGKAAASLKEEDFIERLAISSTHATMLCFSNFGQLYWKKVYEFPRAGRTSRGRPINNLLPLEEGEKITALLPVMDFDPESYVIMATERGVIKKVSLEAFSRPRANGIRALQLDEGDVLVGVNLTNGRKDIMLFSDAGKAVRFKESDIRPMGRGARGVRGIRLKDGQKMISLIVVEDDAGQILTATENGYGKRTAVNEYRTVNRGAQGVVSIQTTERNGKVVGAVWVTDVQDILLITDGGVLVRTPASEVSCIGRNTQGVRLINLNSGESLIGIQCFADLGEEAVSESAGEVQAE
ncbi:MAG: DNA gyrase subunit A, partial [Gammaproteobacteria bacterium]|nr:DNA gyrase subunit A [Gammaproteobacteria bacterium]